MRWLSSSLPTTMGPQVYFGDALHREARGLVGSVRRRARDEAREKKVVLALTVHGGEARPDFLGGR